MYSLDFRLHVLKIGKEDQISIRDLAKRFGIGDRTMLTGSKGLSLSLEGKPIQRK